VGITVIAAFKREYVRHFSLRKTYDYDTCFFKEKDFCIIFCSYHLHNKTNW
jgi:hypothetical protein